MTIQNNQENNSVTIEIKGLPNQKIKNIQFNIEFQESETSDNILLDIAKNNKDNQKSEPRIMTFTNEANESNEADNKNEIIQLMDDEIKDRVQKDIPNEMLDMEF